VKKDKWLLAVRFSSSGFRSNVDAMNEVFFWFIVHVQSVVRLQRYNGTRDPGISHPNLEWLVSLAESSGKLEKPRLGRPEVFDSGRVSRGSRRPEEHVDPRFCLWVVASTSSVW
jgi:hypothetical protein